MRIRYRDDMSKVAEKPAVVAESCAPQKATTIRYSFAVVLRTLVAAAQVERKRGGEVAQRRTLVCPGARLRAQPTP